MINLTLILQGINFFIVYLFLRRFLLRPLVDLLEKESAYIQSLETAIMARSETVIRQQQELTNRWRAFQHSFASQLPTLDQARSTIVHNIKPSIHCTHPSAQTISHLVHEVTETSLAKVQDVRW
ncbi:MAG TPA: ATP synthase F0 subunit B [Candidatus Limnocylindria bacterium]|nr:ATP synthase F0 subunit B [Candidatus Limnocylindria bacterium]